MKLELDRDGPPAYAQIIESVEAAVRRGELSAGDRLPPERRLAADLGVQPHDAPAGTGRAGGPRPRDPRDRTRRGHVRLLARSSSGTSALSRASPSS